MQVSLIFKCPDLFIPVMYTDSDVSIVVHVHANIIVINIDQEWAYAFTLHDIVVGASQYVLSAVIT